MKLSVRQRDLRAGTEAYGLESDDRFSPYQIYADACAARDRQVIAYLEKRIAASFYPDELVSVLVDIREGKHVP